MPAPFVFVDELIYSELAKSAAAGDGFAVRGEATTGYSILYPLLVAPAYALDGLVDAHRAAQATNAVAMSLAAVPAFLLGRRVAGPWLGLLVAAGALLVPSLAYTGTITTESLFYPVALAFALALARYLELPSPWRLAVLGIALLAAYATRSQAVSFAPVILTAPVVLALIRGRVGELRRYVALYAATLAGAVGLVAVQALRGRSLGDLLGAYRAVLDRDYDPADVLQYWLWHAEELTLYVAVLPVAALIVLAARSRTLPARVQEHLAVTISLAVWASLVVAAFASAVVPDRVQDRYLFFLAPLLLVCLAAWVRLGAPRPPLVTTLAVATALGLTLVFPYSRFIVDAARSDTLGLLPLWAINEHLVGGRYWLTVLAVAGALTLLFVLVPPRLALLVPLAVVGTSVVVSYAVWSSPRGFKASSVGALFDGIRSVDRDWIDEAVDPGAEVVVLWTGNADRFTVNQNEFFNRRVGRVLYTDQPTPGGFGETRVTARADGVFVDGSGRSIPAEYALLDKSVVPDGDVVARDEALGTTVWRLAGPLSQTTDVTGIYPGDTWSGRTVAWTRLRCRPGVLATVVWSDPNLFARVQTVTATTGGTGATARAVVARVDPDVTFSPTPGAPLRVRVAPGADGRCVVRYVVTPTATPSHVDPASQDDRVLGIHFGPFAYTPDP
jgi:hypothetical protein